MIILFKNLTSQDKSVAVERLIKGSTPSQDFFLMIVLSILTATFGLLLNDIAVIIGSMLIAPMLYPILSLSLGIIMSDSTLIARSTGTILKSLALGIASAFLVTLLFSSQINGVTDEIVSRATPSIPYAIIAIIAGFAASFALVKPQLSETLPGVAISVALVPPMAAIGIGIAMFDVGIASGAFLMFLLNIIGVIFASMITFSLMNFYVKRKVADEVVTKEDERQEIEKQRAEHEIIREKTRSNVYQEKV